MLQNAYIDNFQIHNTATLFLTKVRGLGSPNPRSDRRELTQRHGLLDNTKLYGGRVIELEGIAQGDTSLAAWEAYDSLRGALALGSPHIFRFLRTGYVGIEHELVRVTVDSEVEDDLDMPSRVIGWSVTLVAADPRIYTAVLKNYEYNPLLSTTGGGMAMPMTFPLVFAASPYSHLSALNAGQFSTPPIYTVKGPVTDPIIDNDTLGLSLTFKVTLSSLDTLTVDVENRRVLLNGGLRQDLIVAKDSYWADLAKGTNLLRLRGSGMDSTTTKLVVQYRDARI